ncbi:hypothetical protein [Erythrobacter sp. EC-HK427]|uniref:hypothetical protein n=1 Tax=Erythrobacter sp. EC-HK427 TaxID=2038396 RepID=UPI001253AC3F|nr:hypothetical protein [Erythrobacter sp. EC-HK427]VVT07380.1 conserved hypothetical protein [Erythrobacter sp. EC-HK427]
MTIYFALVDGQPAFFDSDLHGDAIPDDAVKITAQKHSQLMDGQAEGKVIAADKAGKPMLQVPRFSADARRAELVKAVKIEAARRINAVAPMWRQLNDSREPSPEGAARFAQIDAIRQASALIEEDIGSAAAASLGDYPIAANPLWPEID